MSSPRGRWLLEALVNLFLCVVLTYGVLYTAYRYGVPNLGGTRDFFEYEKMIENPLDFDVVEAPFVMRQLPVLVARGVLETGFWMVTLFAAGATVGLMSNLGRVLGEPVPALALLAILGSVTLPGAYPDEGGLEERSEAQSP